MSLVKNYILNKKNKVVLSVTNDIEFDQRVHKMACSLMDLGFDLTVVGRYRNFSKPIDRPYKTFRFRLIFNKKALFYAEYNIKLFLYLLWYQFDVLVANDLDSLLPNFLISKIKRKPLVYDSHELYTEVPELINRPLVRKVWLTIERIIFPRLKNVYTVNDAIADIYHLKYGVEVKVIRNIAPRLTDVTKNLTLQQKINPEGKKMLIMQGAGINMDRGAEELIEAMQWLPETLLYIIGSGDVFESLKNLVKDFKLGNRVFILDKMPYHELMEYTKLADLGLSLDKGTNPNYENSLPNKVFDYIQAQLPLLVSDRKVVADLVSQNDIGFVIDEITPKNIAKIIHEIWSNKDLQIQWKNNLLKVCAEYNWENESKKLESIYTNLSS